MNSRQMKRKTGVNIKDVMDLYEKTKKMMDQPNTYEMKEVMEMVKQTKQIIQSTAKQNGKSVVVLRKHDFTKKIDDLFIQLEKEMKNEKAPTSSLKVNIHSKK